MSRAKIFTGHLRWPKHEWERGAVGILPACAAEPVSLMRPLLTCVVSMARAVLRATRMRRENVPIAGHTTTGETTPTVVS